MHIDAYNTPPPQTDGQYTHVEDPVSIDATCLENIPGYWTWCITDTVNLDKYVELIRSWAKELSTCSTWIKDKDGKLVYYSESGRIQELGTTNGYIVSNISRFWFLYDEWDLWDGAAQFDTAAKTLETIATWLIDHRHMTLRTRKDFSGPCL